MNGRRIILGMGTGRCGTRSLAALLSRQPGTRVTHEERPLLAWRNASSSPLSRRLERMKRRRTEEIIGDVASSYLPYVEEAVACEPDIRLVCLKRPRDEVVASFCQWLDRVHPLPTNHWAKKPPSGWHHEPIWTRVFPQYDTQDREEGIRLYWEHYYRQAESLVARFPMNVRIFDWQEALNSERGQRDLLAFCGFSAEAQVVALCIHEHRGENAPRRQAPAPRSSDSNDPRRCVVLVPFSGHIVQACEEALKELERRGYTVRRVSGYAAIDQARNQLVTDALINGFEETMWIDSDVVFEANDVERLRCHQRPIVCGIYPKKGQQALAVHTLPGTPRLTFGEQGGLVEVKYASTGFLHVRREVYERLQADLNLPVCNEQFAHAMLPFFQPLIVDDDAGPWYLAEDWAFCERARQCGYRIMADTAIRLWHVGTYRYGWEDAGEKTKRFPNYVVNLNDASSDGKIDDRSLAISPALPGKKRTQLLAATTPELARLLATFAWPAEAPRVDRPISEQAAGGFGGPLLERAITRDTKVIVELGSGTGRTTRLLAGHASTAAIIAIDSWRDPVDAVKGIVPESARFSAFLHNCWEHRERILPLCMPMGMGLQTVSAHQIVPQLVYLNGSGGYILTRADIELVLSLFPRAIVVGDQWHRQAIQKTIISVAENFGLRIESDGPVWRFRGLATGHSVIA